MDYREIILSMFDQYPVDYKVAVNIFLNELIPEFEDRILCSNTLSSEDYLPMFYYFCMKYAYAFSSLDDINLRFPAEVSLTDPQY